MQNEKCVLVMDHRLPAGLAANTAAILGITLGRQRPQVVGADVCDGDGQTHLGIIEFPVPVLCAPPEQLKVLRQRLTQPEFSGLTVVDFSDLAQSCKTYEEFTQRMAAAPGSELRYLGLALCGPRRQVNKLTGNLPLLR